MLGATGAVGTQTLKALLNISAVSKITTLGRRSVPNIKNDLLEQHKIDVFNPESYQNLITNHKVAICTFGVGEPSKTSKENFIKIDKEAVLLFAKTSKQEGVRHFQLLSSVAIDSKSSSFFLRIKGELVDELKKLQFDRLSIFQPSMILTPQNRYGINQGILLKIWPIISPLFLGPIKKYRGIRVEQLGQAIALNILPKKQGFEMLTWSDFQEINKTDPNNS